MTASPWTEPVDIRLRALHAEGLSNAQIAAALTREVGKVFSRNAVIGRVTRLGLQKVVARKLGRAVLARAEIEAKRPAPRCVAVPDGAEHVPSAPVDRPDAVSLDDLRPGQCRWPLWPDRAAAPGPSDPAYCGAVTITVPGPRGPVRLPYCAACAGLAYAPRVERRRVAA